MKLMYAPQSPYSRKVRASAIELGLADDILLQYARVIPGTPNEEYSQEINPLRKIPALVLDDGRVLFDSTVICEYLDDLAGGGRLLPLAGRNRWAVLTEHSAAQSICDALILIRYETGLRPNERLWSVWVDDQWAKVWSGIEWFEGRAGALDGEVNLAHLTLGSALGYMEFRYPESHWHDRFPAVGGWFRRIGQRPSFRLTLPHDMAPTGPG